MQVQSASDPPKKLALGERAIMADGNEYNMFQLKETGQPVESIYPTEGTPLIIGPERRVQERAESERGAAVPELHASRPNASSSSSTSAACARCIAQAKEKAGRRPLQGHQDDEGRRRPAVEKQSEEIKTRYTQIFKV